MKDFKKYNEYKDTEVDWLGMIPKHWNVSRLKYLSDITTGSKDTENKEDNGIYPFYVRSQTVERISTYSFDGEAILTAGDGVGVCKVWHYVNEKFDFHQRVYKLSYFKDVVGKFLFYYLKQNFVMDVKKLSAKSTVDSLRLPMFQNFKVAYPPISEQQQIANYLDKKTSEIDQLIHKKERLIELLEEERTALINQAVTKGLNPNVPMKESGIEWLGHVPEHWVVGKLKLFCDKITDGSHHSPPTVEKGKRYISVKDVGDNQIEFGNCKHITKEEFNLLVRNGCQPIKNDILLTKDGTIGRAVIVGDDNDFVVLSSLGLIRANQDSFNPIFLREYLVSGLNVDQMLSLIRGSALTRITIEIIKNLFVIKPPLEEQSQIANYLTSKISEVNNIISKTKEQIIKLKEYKTTLISNVVTGKIDIREVILENN